MGIARRKAGTVVRCPKCQGEMIVPTPEEVSAPAAGDLPSALNPVFEDSAFGQLLEAPGASPHPPFDENIAAAADDARPLPPADGLAEPDYPSRQGLFLPLWLILLLVILELVLLPMLFVLGFAVGRSIG
jgi:hypothetical protein